jgi:hypothetical protein
VNELREALVNEKKVIENEKQNYKTITEDYHKRY